MSKPLKADIATGLHTNDFILVLIVTYMLYALIGCHILDIEAYNQSKVRVRLY